MQCNYLKYNYLIFRTPLNYFRWLIVINVSDREYHDSA